MFLMFLFLFLVSWFPACWASCYFPCSGFASCSASTAWAFAKLGFCGAWPPPRGGQTEIFFSQLKSQSQHQGCCRYVQFPRFCITTAKIWNGGPVLQLSYSRILFGKQGKVYPQGMKAGWPQWRGFNPSLAPPFIHLSPPHLEPGLCKLSWQ